jgi:ribosome-associated protein
MAKQKKVSANVSKAKALKIIEFIKEKKANNPIILDLSGLGGFCDYFIICSGEVEPQVKAIYDEVMDQCRKNNIEIHHFQGDESGRWFVVDLFDVVVHIFSEEARQLYNLEYLWRGAKKVEESVKGQGVRGKG